MPLLIATLLTLAEHVLAGEISGLPPHLPPMNRTDYVFLLGNDFDHSGARRID